jgi:Uncharacterized alpha/beta hydrolase domain (DUF2235)
MFFVMSFYAVLIEHFLQVQFAYNMYAKEDPAGWKASHLFKQTFSVHVEIEFLGLWFVLLLSYYKPCMFLIRENVRFRDTVSSVGIIPQQLPFAVSNSSIRYFRHAISLDERRAKFKAVLWPLEGMGHRFTKMLATYSSRKLKGNEEILKELEKAFNDNTRHTNVYEVWFAGAEIRCKHVLILISSGRCSRLFVLSLCYLYVYRHLDVGGGSVVNETPHSLARIPLRWMIRQCFLTNTGIIFQRDRLRTIGLDLDTLHRAKSRPPPFTFNSLRKSRKPSEASEYLTLTKKSRTLTEEEEDYADVLSEINDQLCIAKGWWIVEYLVPVKLEVQCKDGTWKRKVW